MKYIVLPFVVWIIAGSSKFVINYLRYGKKAKKLIGYGGFPSTHTTILSSVVVFSGLSEGFTSPLFSLGMGSLLIVVIDAHGLRQKVGQQAKIINELQRKVFGNDVELLREKMGHTWIEIFGGLLYGSLLAWIFYMFR